jgi:hypothetical protein
LKPSVQEQLQGTCRILETVVAPCVNDALARTVLDGLIANLAMLSGALPSVAGFLRDDNDRSLQLLAMLRPSLAPSLGARIDTAAALPRPDDTDLPALDERNRLLRELLAAAVCAEGLGPDQHREIVEHMSTRARSAPMRYVSTAPKSPVRPSATK